MTGEGRAGSLAQAGSLTSERNGRTGTGAQAIVWSLEGLGVTTVFGIPGGNVIPLYDALFASSRLRHVLTRHEQGAGHAAEGYAIASGQVGVVIATSGPGATNLVTAIADAYLNSVPLLVITGQVFSTLIGTDAFQGADILGITIPIIKHSFRVTSAEEIPQALAEAHLIASTGRRGPVLVDITKDAQQASAVFVWPIDPDLQGYHPVRPAHHRQIEGAVDLIHESCRPVLLLGGGAVQSSTRHEIGRLVRATGMPVLTTLMGRGSFPDSDQRSVGMPGINGSEIANAALRDSDLVIAVGTSLDDRMTGGRALFAPNAKLIHIDVDPSAISRTRVADQAIVGYAQEVLASVAARLGATNERPNDLTRWWAQIKRGDSSPRISVAGQSLPAPERELRTSFILRRIRTLTGPRAVYTTGSGQHQFHAARTIRIERPQSWITSGGSGTRGFAVPSAMGAKLADPDAVVWAIDGDGGFQMTNQELATCVLNNIPIKVAIINDAQLGTTPDFAGLADAYGAIGIRVTRPVEVDAAIQTAIDCVDKCAVIDFVVTRDDGSGLGLRPRVAAYDQS